MQMILKLRCAPGALRPVDPSVNFISVQGVQVTRIANGFLRASTGAICNLGGHHWRIEQCRLHAINSSGVECSDRAGEYADTNNPYRRHMAMVIILL